MDSDALKKSKYFLTIALLFGYWPLSGCDSVTSPPNGQIRNSAELDFALSKSNLCLLLSDKGRKSEVGKRGTSLSFNSFP